MEEVLYSGFYLDQRFQVYRDQLPLTIPYGPARRIWSVSWDWGTISQGTLYLAYALLADALADPQTAYDLSTKFMYARLVQWPRGHAWAITREEIQPG